MIKIKKGNNYYLGAVLYWDSGGIGSNSLVLSSNDLNIPIKNNIFKY